MSTPRICLVMMVKDEERVVARAIRSALKFPIVTWLITDTGSTDKTKEVVRKALKEIPGELIDEPWVSFAHNRNRLLELAKGYWNGKSNGLTFSHVLMLDADDTLEYEPDFAESVKACDWKADCYGISVNHGFQQMVHLINPWASANYSGVTHEGLYNTGTKSFLGGVSYLLGSDGHRRNAKVDGVSLKLVEDAKLLEKQLITADGLRAIFYLAQTYNEMGKTESAVTHYAYRSRIVSGNLAEVYLSHVRLGFLLPSNCAYHWTQAFNLMPERPEALHHLIRFFRTNGTPLMAYTFAKAGEKCLGGLERHHMFLDSEICDWKLLDEISLAYYGVGETKKARNLFELLLKIAPESEHERLNKNIATIGGKA